MLLVLIHGFMPISMLSMSMSKPLVHVRVCVCVCGGVCVHVRVHVYKCRNVGLSGIRSVLIKTNGAGTDPVLDQVDDVQHFFGPEPD